MSNPNKNNKEIERKYLVDTTKWSPNENVTTIIQFYLCDTPTIRVRMTNEKCYLTIKGKLVGITRTEFEYEIPKKDAMDIIDLAIYPPIHKKRYELEYEGNIWTVDVFSGKNEGLVLAEIELESEEHRFDIPEWAYKDVTNDYRYYNSNLAVNPFTEWK